MRRISKAQKEAFLERLGETGDIREACGHAGISRSTVHRWRRSNEAFARRVREALDQGVDLLEFEVLRRAIHGWTVPVFHQGRQCGEVRKYSDRLAIIMLKAHRPATYGDRQAVEHSGALEVKAIMAAVDGKTRGIEGFRRQGSGIRGQEPARDSSDPRITSGAGPQVLSGAGLRIPGGSPDRVRGDV